MPTPIRRAALIARPRLPAALAAMTDAADWLVRRGCGVAVEEQSARHANVELRGRGWDTVTRDALARDADVVLAFGGDGTLLDAASAVAHSPHDAPLLGVNLGRLGFLTDAGRPDLTETLQAILDGRTRTETRLMLAGAVHRGDGVAGSHLALNDVVVTRGALSRMIEVGVMVDGQQVSLVKADGLIVATATGSTAYNLSAGGPIVLPSVDALVLTPIAPHALTLRPLVLPATARIELRPMVEPQSDLVVTFDGQYGVPLEAGDRVEIARATRVLTLLRVSRRTHFDMLREKLKWG
jgi:NAD+ kinase